MNKIITLNINDREVDNEYRFGNIRMNKQTDFLHYFWLALSLCHEVISISKDKQKLVKEHFDDILMFHGDGKESQNNSKFVKKRTYDQRLDRPYTANMEAKANDDFHVGTNNKLMSSSEDSKSVNEDEKQEEQQSLENDDFDISENQIDDDEELVYHGMSPDEITLVEAAKKVGYEFRYRSNNEIEIKIGGVKQVFKLLEIFKFTSERKRMSVVVQDPEDPDFVIVFTKGADNIMKNISFKQFHHHFDFSSIGKFAKRGYRTLLVGMKVIRYDEFCQWKEVYDEYNNDIENDHTESMNELIQSIEKEIFLLGTTALEDKLQENVHECIEEFRRADCKVWMITGDKLETAENVGISCRLLHDDAERFHFTAKDPDQARKEARKTYWQMKRMVKKNNEMRQIYEEEDDSDDESLDLERESENEVEVAEEAKNYELEKNMNSSYHTQQYTNGTTNKKLAKLQTLHEDQYSSSDLFAPDKKLKITEKKLFVKQMVLNSSLNTSFNPNRIKNGPVAELNFELVIEGD